MTAGTPTGATPTTAATATPAAAVQTVLGPVAASDLGITSAHEHLHVDLSCWFDPPAEGDAEAARLAGSRVRADDPALMAAVRANPFAVHDNLRLDDEDLVARDMIRFREAGGRTIVDLTTDELGRDPAALQRLAGRTGVNVVMGCGHYIGRSHPPGLAERGVAALAAGMIRDLTEGVEVYGDEGPGRVRAGAIGEIGTSDPIEAAERTVLEAACRAQLATGTGLYVHLDPWGRAGHAALDICEESGVSPERVVLCHMDPSLVGGDLSYARSLALRGAWVSIDICGDEDAYGGRGMPSDAQRVAAVRAAFDEGWGDRLILAQDVCLKSQLHAFGGRGYDHLLTGIAPALRAVGLPEQAVVELLVDHPRRVLVGGGPGTGARASREHTEPGNPIPGAGNGTERNPV
jgi:phosphotriesterase-related protein